ARAFNICPTMTTDNYISSLNPTQLRILQLLGNNIPQAQVAQAVGVDESYISQLMAKDEFREYVTRIKFEKLQERNEIDSNYDDMEREIQKKMRQILPMIQKPRDVLDFATKINAMKRRGNLGDTTASTTQTVVELTLPVAILNKIIVDPQTNRVIEASGSPMLTAPSSTLVNLNGNTRTDTAKIGRARQAISSED